jgi:hypothetical protein
MRTRNLLLSCLIVGILLPIAKPSFAQADTMFPDVPKNHWAYEAVKSLKELGIVKGYPPEPKRRGGQTTNARPVFNAPILATEPQDAIFRDLPTSHWVYASVRTLQQSGLIEGYPPDYFGRRYILTRYEIAVAIKRAVERLFDAQTASSKPLSAKERILLLELLDEFRTELRSLGGKDATKYEQRLLLR